MAFHALIQGTRYSFLNPRHLSGIVRIVNRSRTQVYKPAERGIVILEVSRHYSDSEWARIVAGVWAAERPGQVRMFMTTKRTMWSSELGREYGWVLCPIRRPSRALVVWLLANLEEQA